VRILLRDAQSALAAAYQAAPETRRLLAEIERFERASKSSQSMGGS
jgi:hypothetical protein